MIVCKFEELCSLIQYVDITATKIQAQYKGYRVKGEFKKQKEAGRLNCKSECFTTLFTLP